MATLQHISYRDGHPVVDNEIDVGDVNTGQHALGGWRVRTHHLVPKTGPCLLTAVAVGLAALALILGVAALAIGSELTITGEHEVQYRYLFRTGPNDLFGNVNAAQNSTTSPRLTSIGLSGPWNNVVVPEGFSSKGADTSIAWQRLDIRPTWQINRAVSLHATLSLTGSLNGPYTGGSNWTDPPHYSGMSMFGSRSESAASANAVPVFRELYTQIQLPVGVVTAGRKNRPFGIGWSGFDTKGTALSGVTLSTKEGPVTTGFTIMLPSSGEWSDPNDSRNTNNTPLTVASALDKNETRAWDSIITMSYSNGGLDVGGLVRANIYRNIHALPQGPGTLRDDQTNAWPRRFLLAYRNPQTDGADEILIPVYGDASLITGTLYGKWTNGRTFLNAEYAQQWLNVTRQGGRPITGHPQSWMLELGAFAGPAKITLAHHYRSGHDRQGGILDVASTTGANGRGGRNGTTQVGDTWHEWISFSGSPTPMKPYAYLLPMYGGGNNAYDPCGLPTFTDWGSYAARFDYAAASNLNLWASYAYARRSSNTGSWWGQYTGGIDTQATRLQSTPNVPNNSLGEEIGIGAEWKLLENVTWNTRAAYWKPGPWFKHAYTDYSTIVNDQYGAGVRINPDRKIDPIFGIQTGIDVQF